MTLALTCDGDSANSSRNNPESSLTWLQLKKEQKASTATTLSIHENLAEELDKFCAEPNISENTNPFEWWAFNKTKYPFVAAVAREYLAIPATSVASERIFSKCGLVCSDRRASLSPQHVEQLVFLSHNLNNM